MPPYLNTVFKGKSNAAFNNGAFMPSKISTMHETTERLYLAAKDLRKITGQSDLARALNASPQTVKNWESRGVSKQGMLDAQRLIGCSALWLETGLGTMLAVNEKRADYNVEQGPDIRGTVPLISWVQAGSWCGVVDNFAPGDAEDWMPCIKRVGPHAFALRVRGVSMEPKYQDGDIIFVDPDVAAEHGKNVIVRLDDAQEATFKNLVVEGSRRFLRPLNPDWPEKMIEVNGNATICGVVVGKWVPE